MCKRVQKRAEYAIKWDKSLFLQCKFKYLDMNEIIEKIAASFEAFNTDAALQAEKENKAAGTRARKASLELEKLLKEFRKTSLEASKK